MLKESELLELTDEDLLSIIGNRIVLRVTRREEAEPDEEAFSTVVTVGTLIELQYSPDTGGSVASLYTGNDKPDEVRWDSDEYQAVFIWRHVPSTEE